MDKIYQEIKRCSNTKVKDLSENALKNTLEQSVVDINGNCTGFIITDTGLCLTCKHCIKEDPRNRLVRIKHYLQNGQIIETPLTYDVVFTSEDKDLALIYLRSEHEQIKNSIHYPYIPLEQYKNAYIEKLQKFISAGYPLGGEDYENLSIIKGEVATIHHQAKRLMGWANMLSLPGSSGSPLVSVNTGKAIGLFQGVKNTKQDNYQSDNVKCFLPIGDIWREIWKFFGIKNHLKREHKKV